MRQGFSRLTKTLQSLLGKFDEESQNKLQHTLALISKLKLTLGRSLISYHEILLFLCAHPFNKKQVALVEKELTRITSYLKRKANKLPVVLTNTGLPHTTFISTFSHDCLTWLINQPHFSIELFQQSNYSLNSLLAHTLPSLERSNTTAGFNNQELLDALKVKKSELLTFYLNQFSTLNGQPSIKDYLFDELNLEIKIIPKNTFFSRTYNRVPVSDIFFHRNWSKQFDAKELLNRSLPEPTVLPDKVRDDMINVIKYAMTLNDRETDPTTYLDSKSLRLYELERGVSVALYGMEPNRQLPLESYVGFTLFKNGFPAAYGGSWVFGERANFGINIFETFRGGESGYVMCQLLRVYRKAFGISFFEVEPYQFGLDNPEGITSGAFWFYYRYGFRPLDKQLRALASVESRKIVASRSYRTSKSVLTKFTESNLALNLGETIPPSLPSITQKITKMIQQQFKSNRVTAVAECVHLLKTQTKIKHPQSQEELNVLQEVALVAKTLQVVNPDSLAILVSMIKTKPIDLYAYQQELLKFLQKTKKQ